MDYKEIDKRYTELAEKKCCLSCGGAINHTDIRSGEICVDLGSGRGTDALRLAEQTGSSGFVFGIDISEGMIKKSFDTAKRLGINNVKFINSPLEKLDLKNESVDLVISNCTINHSHDKQAVWNEVHRILRKGGRFVVSDIYSKEPVPEEYKNDPVAVAECWAGSVTSDIYMSQLKQAGFMDVSIIEESDFYEKGKIFVASWTLKGYKQQ